MLWTENTFSTLWTESQSCTKIQYVRIIIYPSGVIFNQFRSVFPLLCNYYDFCFLKKKYIFWWCDFSIVRISKWLFSYLIIKLYGKNYKNLNEKKVMRWGNWEIQFMFYNNSKNLWQFFLIVVSKSEKKKK